MSQDEEGTAVVLSTYDPSVHTIEKLRLIVDEIFIEGATLYCQKLRLIREQKKDGEFKGKETITTLEEKQKKELRESETDTFKEYKVTEELVSEWLSHHADDTYIKKKFDKLKELHDMVFGSE